MEVDVTMEEPFTKELQQSETQKNLKDSYQGPGAVVLNRIVTLSLVKLPVLTVSRITGQTVLMRALPALRTTPNLCYNFMHVRSESQELHGSLHHVNGKDAIAIRYVNTNDWAYWQADYAPGLPGLLLELSARPTCFWIKE